MNHSYDNLLFDADGTLYDWEKTEHKTVELLWEEFKFPKDSIQTYIRLSCNAWEDFSSGSLAIEDLHPRIFKEFINEIGYNHLDPKIISDKYLQAQIDFLYFYDQSREVLQELKSRGYHIYIATNGIPIDRFTKHKEEGLFEDVFYAQVIHSYKPQKDYFEKIFQILNLDEEGKRKTVMIGDSLKSDIQGGANAGLTTVWFNRNGKYPYPVEPVKPDYEIHELKELLQLFPKKQ
ncbi:noncanonical pyrimidine nucleotidase, YjjG family [Histomonas meleagridis]|uniref:noncanonical pyrimidine nucleotidase, YjjG family n=1 Tax=Histomonas meleagridis TaxID=135588 RepID=UPI00355AA2DF|nr:noncanonical pyrimidine nucleotidase, YjjG family [Histomonas meleagridis]KAH0805503.1 noncanonical pyrimidine nucleotidase, YjjG family [Histomonas meleagridis]